MARFLDPLPDPSDSPLYHYTTGSWLFNEDRRKKERTRYFDVAALCQLAAESVGRERSDVAGIEKLAEGGFNRTLVVTMRDGFKLVARIPYPLTNPQSLCIASEVATMAYLHSRGLPTPEIFDYSCTSDNPAKTEYIFMSFVNGSGLDDVWDDLTGKEKASFVRQLVQLEKKMMSTTFPAAGGLYRRGDLRRLTGCAGIPLEGDDSSSLEGDDSLCVGPDTSVQLWFGRRAQLDLDRGPYLTVEAALEGVAKKELAALEKFDHPLWPFERERREAYGFKLQSPTDHAENLRRYLTIASLLPPKNPDFCQFRLRHPDPHLGNFIVSRSPDPDDLRVEAIIDFQHTPILPTFLLAAVPHSMKDHGCNDLYLANTARYNKLHYAVLQDPMGPIRRRLFFHAGAVWEGETHELKLALIEARKHWRELTGGGRPCPFDFDPEDVSRTLALEEELKDSDKLMQGFRDVIGCASTGWVPIDRYAQAKATAEEMKRQVLERLPTEKDRADIEKHWPLDDMDEEDYI